MFRRALSAIHALVLLLALSGPSAVHGQGWPLEFHDPAAEEGEPADLSLPMPCGGAMAFQKVVVPADTTHPLSDRQMRLGASDPESGHLDYFVNAYLRGAFSDGAGGNTHYFISRYELTNDQHAAVLGDCEPPSLRGRFPKLGLSWFEAVEFTRLYSEWLRAEAGGQLPAEDGFPAFVRLPTETEWEYAARGGIRVDEQAFGARQFPMPEGVDHYAWYYANSRGQPRPVGTRGANPLGLHDVYGNAEELILEPFRMNALGRPHGQAGGLVARGGSYRSTADEMYSARRSEWPLFRVTDGQPSAEDTFGVRLVLSTHVSVSDRRLAEISDNWIELFEGPAGQVDDPISEVTLAIEEETNARRKARLIALRELIREDRQKREEAERRILRSTLLNGAILIRLIRDSDRSIERIGRDVVRMSLQIDREGDVEERRKLLERLERARAAIERLRPVREDALQTFGQTLESAASSLDPDRLFDMRDMLRLELGGRGQDVLLALVNDFHDDFVTFSGARDMSPAELLELAVEP